MATSQDLTQNEQLFLELVNRARLDPAAEAERYGIGLNDPTPGNPTDEPSQVLTADPKQPLAHNPLLALASTRHSDDMLARNYFDHEAEDTQQSPAPYGVEPGNRMDEAGYTDRSATGENIARLGTTGTPDFEEYIRDNHAGLFRNAGHRENILEDAFRETGVAHVEGIFTPRTGNFAGVDFKTGMLTHKFGTSGTEIFLTGVAYNDLDGDEFYSIGESKAGVDVSVAGTSGQTAPAGGYTLALAGGTTQTELSYTWDGETRTVTVDMGGHNVKVDMVGGNRIMASGDLALGDGLTEGGLLGAGDLILTGNDLDNLLIAGRGNNIIDGGDGYDIARFSGSKADYQISSPQDSTIVTDTRTGVESDGENDLTGIEKLIFADGYHLFPGDGPMRVTGHLQDAAGDDMVGASVEFTPQDDATPKWGMATDATGGFDLGLASGAAGRLHAHLDVREDDPDITAGDALNVLRIAVGLEPSFGPAQAQNFVAADLNGDQRVTADDALEVLRHAVGLESEHAPKWAFFDADTDWQTLEIDKDNVTVERGVDIASLGTDADVTMTGILLGNMDTV